MKTIINSLALLICFCACTKKANISLPVSEPKLVVTCFISPQDTVIGAVVRLSNPKRGINGSVSLPTEGIITNATVSIFSNGPVKNLRFDETDLFYKLPSTELPIEAGKTYQLHVTTPDGKHVYGSTTVPGTSLEILSLRTSISSESATKLETDLEVSVKDIPGQTTYLGIFNQQTFTPQNAAEPFTVMGYFDCDEKINTPVFHHYSGTSFYSADTLKSAFLTVSVLNCSKEFYWYNKSVQESGIGALNPFADPVMVYTNITNGFGCFGGYNGTKRSIRLR